MTIERTIDESEIQPLLGNRLDSLSEECQPVNNPVSSDFKNTVKLKLTIISMCLANLMCFMNYSLVAPIFPPVALRKGMSKTVIGFVIGVYNIAIVLTAPVFGLIISRVGAKFMFVTSCLFTAVCSILFGVTIYGPDGATFTVLCMLTRILQAIGASAFTTSSYTIIANKFPDKVATYLALIESFTGAGLMVGAPLGGFLYQAGGYYVPYTVCGLMQLLLGIVAWVVVTPVTDIYTPRSTSIFAYTLKYRTLSVAMVVVTMGFGVTYLEATLANYVSRFDLQPYQIGFLFLIMPGLYAVTGPVYGYISDKKGYLMTMMITGSFVCAVMYSSLGPAPFFGVKPKLWILIMSFVVIGLFVGMTVTPVFPSLLSVAMDLGFENNFDTSGMISGVMVSSLSLGGFAGGSFGGILVDYLGFPWSGCVIGLLFLLVTINLIIYTRIYKRPGTNSIFIASVEMSRGSSTISV